MKKLTFRKLMNLYFLLFIINLLFVGLLGIRPLIQTIKKEHSLEKTLKETKETLENKQATLESLKNTLEETKQERESLEKVIPQKDELDNYLIDVVRIAATQGFELVSFSKGEQTDQKIEITIIVTGDVTRIGNLIETLENATRMTAVENILVGIDKKDPNAVIKLGIYSLGETT